MKRLIASLLIVWSAGCSLVPTVAHQPVVHNPFPQLSKVAIAPFFNLSSEPTVDGRQFALAYFNELQLVQGFEVVPVGVVEKTIEAYQLSLDSPDDARRLAQILGVDAVVIGAVTDFTPYYPPRCGMQVEWYAANPCFHPIPAGYGLPWGTTEEEFIPAPLVFEAEMALAKAQLRTQAPPTPSINIAPPPVAKPVEPELLPPGESSAKPLQDGDLMRSGQQPKSAVAKASATSPAGKAQHAAVSPAQAAVTSPQAQEKPAAATEAPLPGAPELPANWPTAQAFVPAPPCANVPECQPSREPVLRHTRTYNGHDAEFTTALESYAFFRDDARFGGWQAYLQRSDDFIRFCCHLHISEMLSARGGAGETRVVWRWPESR